MCKKIIIIKPCHRVCIDYRRATAVVTGPQAVVALRDDTPPLAPHPSAPPAPLPLRYSLTAEGGNLICISPFDMLIVGD